MDQLSFTIGAFVGAGLTVAIIVLAVLSYIGVRDGARAEERYRLKCGMEQAMERQRALRQAEVWGVCVPQCDDTRVVRR